METVHSSSKSLDPADQFSNSLDYILSSADVIITIAFPCLSDKEKLYCENRRILKIEEVRSNIETSHIIDYKRL